MPWIRNLTEWIESAAPGAPPVPRLDGAPPELVAAVHGLARRLGGEAPALIDRERFAELASLGDPALLRHITDTFFGGLPGQIEQLDQAARRGDAAAVRGLAHTIKGGAASAGLPATSHLAAQLEDAARAGKDESFTALLEQLREALEATREAVDAELA